MFRKNKDINDICQEREQLLSQLRHSKRINITNEKRNSIMIYDSINELLSAHPDLRKSNCYSTDCIMFMKDCWEESIGCFFTLKNNHFLMTKVDKFEEITDIISDFDIYKYMIIYSSHKYIYIDNQFDLRNLIENSSNIFKWWYDTEKLMDQTHGEIITCYYPCDNEYNVSPYRICSTNILEEAYNYIRQNYMFPL